MFACIDKTNADLCREIPPFGISPKTKTTKKDLNKNHFQKKQLDKQHKPKKKRKNDRKIKGSKKAFHPIDTIASIKAHPVL